MTTPKTPPKDIEKHSIDFLGRDFNQCFEQMRHYDTQIVSIFKFMFAAYTGLIGIALGLYQFGVNSYKDLSMPAVVVLAIGFLLGLFFFALVIRDRLYYVQVTRYINEQRELFFKHKPLGFENKSRMYTDPTKPPYFSPLSSQAWFTYIIAILNATLLGAMLYIVLSPSQFKCLFLVIPAAVILIALIQLIIGIAYLKTREGKTAEKAVWGEEKEG